ncbi:MAG: PadR family transcriptional regulator, partial [Actinomycetota bacterium]|nr:PadR family transcriptional regulator [Actinomycetota bacterium]
MLELAILGLLKEQALHGYELKKRLAEMLGPFSGASFGSLYP